MKKKFIKSFLILLILISESFANDVNNENSDLYQVKIILIEHNFSNNLAYNKSHVNEKFFDNDSIKINSNNCLINLDQSCVKYEKDYKLETFKEYIKAIEADNNIKIITHLEWIQNFNDILNVKIKNGYDYSEEIINEDIDLIDIDIIGLGKITKYEGYINITKNKFFKINLNLLERMKMKSPGFFEKDILVSKKYKISQKIKLNKTTYIDRDNFGLIIKIEKIKDF